jgi:hypothetical protein
VSDSELDQLGYLDINEIDNLVSLADNMAVKLAYDTINKLGNVKNRVGSERKKVTR